MKKRIVVYYSFEGNTREAALQIKEMLGADIVEINTEKEIPKNSTKKFMIGGMQATFKICPKIKNVDIEFEKYDEIVLGTPIWAGKCTPAINSFLKIKSIKEKVTAVFTCSGGGDNDKCMTDFKKRLPNLKYSVALADKNNALSKENEKHIHSFVEEIIHGK
jgi:flavodoxin